jgi:flavin reductase (DIM6/NTAB) family NADH-FMN oxidoreductase RutF
MTETARTLPLGESELARVDLELVPFDGFPLPRLKDCRVALACELYDIQEIGAVPQSLVFGRIRQVFVADPAVTEDDKGRVRFDAACLDPLSRLGGSEYATFGGVIKVPRPA